MCRGCYLCKVSVQKNIYTHIHALNISGTLYKKHIIVDAFGEKNGKLRKKAVG